MSTNELQQFMPVTEHEHQSNKITNSVKIGKQLMRAQLTKTSKQLREKYEVAVEDSRAAHSEVVKKIRADLKSKLRLEINSDSEITRLRNLLIKFSPEPDEDDEPMPKTNMDIVYDWDYNHSVLADAKLALTVLDSVEPDALEKVEGQSDYAGSPLQKAISFIKDNEIDVEVSFDLPALNEDIDTYNWNRLGYNQTFCVSNETIGLVRKSVDAEKITRDLINQINEVDKKLNNIDEVAEEMEAQLLVNSLSRTAEGQEALKVAGELVSNMLGTTPNMLADFSNQEDK